MNRRLSSAKNVHHQPFSLWPVHIAFSTGSASVPLAFPLFFPRSERDARAPRNFIPPKLELLARRAVSLMVLATLFSFVVPSVRATDPPRELRPARLRMLYSASLFSTISRNDALAAMNVWVQTLGRRQGFALEVENEAYDRVKEAMKRVQAKTVETIICNPLEYLQMAQTGQLEPVFTPGWQQVSDDYVVLTRRDRNLAALADLRGKSVVYFATGANLGRLWMDVTLGESGLGAVNDFFGSNSEAAKSSSVILPVFFGKIDVAVAKRWSWEVMKEMNPQLETQLQILTNSPGLPEAVTCINRDVSGFQFRDDLVRGLAELHTDPQGQQILLLFKIDKMVPFQSQHLDGVRDLKARQAELERLRSKAETVATSAVKPKS